MAFGSPNVPIYLLFLFYQKKASLKRLIQIMQHDFSERYFLPSFTPERGICFLFGTNISLNADVRSLPEKLVTLSRGGVTPVQ